MYDVSGDEDGSRDGVDDEQDEGGDDDKDVNLRGEDCCVDGVDEIDSKSSKNCVGGEGSHSSSALLQVKSATLGFPGLPGTAEKIIGVSWTIC